MRGFLPASAATVRSSGAGPQLAGGPWPRGLRAEAAALAWPQARCHRGAVYIAHQMAKVELQFLLCAIEQGQRWRRLLPIIDGG